MSEIPHLYVKQMLDALYGRNRAAARRPIRSPKRTGRTSPNLVGGDFEHGSRRRAQGLGQGRAASSASRWAGWSAGWPKRATPATRSSASRSTRNVAENEGVMYYSDYFPVEEGAKYRFQCRWRADGPAVKVFIKCYDEIGTPVSQPHPAKRRRRHRPGKSWARTSIFPIRPTPRGLSQPAESQRPGGTRGTRTPRTSRRNTPSTRPSGAASCSTLITIPGAVEFDDVVVKQIVARLARRAEEGPPPFQRNENHRSKRSRPTSAAAAKAEERTRRQ